MMQFFLPQSLNGMPWQRTLRALPFALALFYLSFHAISGERGIYAWFKQKHTIEALQQELGVLQSQREAYEQKITHLRRSSLDLDLLDEQARRQLGFIEQDEIIILNVVDE